MNSDMIPVLLEFLLSLLLAVLVLLVGIKLIHVLVKAVRKVMERSRLDPGMISFLCSLLRYSLYFVLAMMILSQFGVTTGSVVALLGSAGLTLGLALQGSLQNFAGGVLILMLKPFVVGDYIVSNSGEEGTVQEITIYYTHLLTIDNRVVLVPNGSLSNSSITNVTRMEKRRVDLTVGISYDADLAKAKKILLETAEQEDLLLKEEPIDVYVSELAESSVNMGIRVWTKTENYWILRWHLVEEIKKKLDENQISIPYPKLDVHIKQ